MKRHFVPFNLFYCPMCKFSLFSVSWDPCYLNHEWQLTHLFFFFWGKVILDIKCLPYFFRSFTCLLVNTQWWIQFKLNLVICIHSGMPVTWEKKSLTLFFNLEHENQPTAKSLYLLCFCFCFCFCLFFFWQGGGGVKMFPVTFSWSTIGIKIVQTLHSTLLG